MVTDVGSMCLGMWGKRTSGQEVEGKVVSFFFLRFHLST